MLDQLYQEIDSIEQRGKEIVLPDHSTEAIYLSRSGELFCYTGIYLKSDHDREVLFGSWPYYLRGKHTTSSEKQIRGLFRIKNGCILLTRFLDHDIYSDSYYKQLINYIVKFPTVNDLFFGIEKRIETENSWYFEENEKLSRACFGLSYSELNFLVKLYAEKLGLANSYIQYPRITRSMKNDNFCDITGAWIPAGFPYISFNASQYAYSHVSLFGFYRHVGALLSMGRETLTSKLFQSELSSLKIIELINQINDYFPFEIVVTREYIVPEMYV